MRPLWLWLYPMFWRRYCHRCDRLLLPWQTCPHNKYWRFGS